MNLKDLENFYTGLVSMLITLVCTLFGVGMVFVCISYLKKTRKVFILSTIAKAKQKKASPIMSESGTYHIGERSFVFNEELPSEIKYTITYSSLYVDNKLSIYISWIVIGGLHSSIKSLLFQLKNIYMLLLLNNNISNSVISSDKHRFNTKIDINETFIFKIDPHELPKTSLVIEVYADFKEGNRKFLIGWVEVPMTDNMNVFPIKEEKKLEVPQRSIDRFCSPLGFVCISLASLEDKIKLGIFSTAYLNLGDSKAIHDNILLFFTVAIIGIQNSYDGVTHCRKLNPTIVWNDIFLFDIPDENKLNTVIEINLWANGFKNPAKIGSVCLGMGEMCSTKAQKHWAYILNHKEEEYTKWYIIRTCDVDK